MDLRIGNGFDVHRFSHDPARRCVLGGVVVPDAVGLAGHSDADVVAHAVADALLGAVGLGDIGSLYPDTDPRWEGADSMRLLADVVGRVGDAGFRVLNVDCSVIAEQPRLAPHRQQMQDNLAAVLGAPASVKGRRAEGIGGIGRREGIVCLCSALVVRDGGAS